MEALNIIHGMATVLSDPLTVVMVFLGVLAGVFVGALPGLTATTGCALLLPFTFGHEPLQGILILVGVFCGGIYGGSLSAILLRTPGTPAAAATMLDGFPMSERGEAGRAIGLATMASFVGGTVGAIIMTLLAPKLAAFGLAFGPPEYFALTLFGIAMIVAVSGDSLVKGILAASIGMWITTIGFDPIAAKSRYTFGFRELLGGIELIPILVGMFGVTQVFLRSEQLLNIKRGARERSYLPKIADVISTQVTAVKSAIIGVFVGSVPGAGCDIAAFAAYSELKRSNSSDGEIGNGSPKGIVAPEAANNAATTGALIPMLSLGVPGDAVTAVMLGALTIHGFEPGPVFFTSNLDLIYALFAGVILAQLALLVVGLSLAPAFARIIQLDQRIMIPVILFLCMIGSYSVRYSVFDMYVALFFGCIGFLFEKVRIPLSPMLLGIVLGTLSEQNLRRSLLMSQGDALIFLQRPVSLTLMLAAIAAIVLMLVRIRKRAD